MKIYVVTKDWNNGDSYEDERGNYDEFCKAFLTKEKAIEWINNETIEKTEPIKFDGHESYIEHLSKYESQLLRSCFSWDEDKIHYSLDCKKAWENVCGIYSNMSKYYSILYESFEVYSEYGAYSYEIKEVEAV